MAHDICTLLDTRVVGLICSLQTIGCSCKLKIKPLALSRKGVDLTFFLQEVHRGDDKSANNRQAFNTATAWPLAILIAFPLEKLLQKVIKQLLCRDPTNGESSTDESTHSRPKIKHLAPGGTCQLLQGLKQLLGSHIAKVSAAVRDNDKSPTSVRESVFFLVASFRSFRIQLLKQVNAGFRLL
jgi:hypothetical protein